MIIHHIIPSEDITIYMQKLPQPHHAATIPLSEQEEKKLRSLKNNQRKREFLAIRNLLYQAGFDGSLIYNKKQPQLKNSAYNISISHCKTHAALAISQYPVGIDLEIPANRIRKTAGKFLSNKEIKLADNDTRNLTLFWSAKESIFKINNNLSNFRKHLNIIAHDTNNNYISVECSDHHRSCFYKDMMDVLVTWCIEGK
ncbi:MAG: 4'-phosphopantetheinyl transferase family protein [Bacteroidota bacterium]